MRTRSVEDASAADVRLDPLFRFTIGSIGRLGPSLAEDEGGGEPTIRTMVRAIVWLWCVRKDRRHESVATSIPLHTKPTFDPYVVLLHAMNVPAPAPARGRSGKSTCEELQRILDRHQPRHPLLVQRSERGRGTFAKRDLRKGEALLSIPLHDVLAVSRLERGVNRHAMALQHQWQTANRTRFPWKMAAALQRGTPPSVALALWVSWMMKLDHIPLQPYYEASLPKRDTLASLLLATKDEVFEIQFEEEIGEVLAMHEWVQRAYAWNIAGQFDEELGDSDHFTYMIALVMSRSFAVDTTSGPLALTVPFCDLSNHDFRPNCLFQLSTIGLGNSNITGSFQFLSDREIAEGEELTISYGERLTNWKLLKHYGFSSEDNPYDTVHFGNLALLPKEVAREADIKYNKGVARGRPPLQHCYKEGIMASLFANGGCNTPLKWHSTAQKLHTHCTNMLDQTPTDYEEDERLLASSAVLSPTLRSIIKYRAQKKHRIASCRALLEELLDGSTAL